MSDTTNDRAAMVVRAHQMLMGMGPGQNGGRDELRDIIRRLIAGLPPEAADAALVDLFREIEILDDVVQESHGYVRNDDTPDGCPF